MDMYNYFGIAVLVIATSVIATVNTIHMVRKWRQARVDTIKLIDTVMTNAEENLGYPPDAASIAYLANHPFLSAKIWEMTNTGGRISPEDTTYRDDCERLIQFIRDDSFGENYPCARAIFQYAVHLCDNAWLGRRRDGTLIRRFEHPKDEI